MTTVIGATAGTARTPDGVELRTLRWPAVGAARSHLLLIHGIAEHAGRHAHVASRFASAGIETHAFDLRGFGASEGRRAYVDRWSQYHDDLEDQLQAVRAGANGLPVVLYGHSMGGLIALGYVLADPLGRAMPHVEIANGIPAGALSHDPQVEIAYRSDPLNAHRTTVRLGMELFHERTRVEARLAKIGALPGPT